MTAQNQINGGVNGSYHQIEFTYSHVGRRFPLSKRICSWKFGFTESTTDGAHRREEHCVLFIWSLLSKKANVYFDDRNVTRECLRRESQIYRKSANLRSISIKRAVTCAWELEWNSDKGRSMKILVHADKIPEVRHQYNLMINGQSYFDLDSAPHFSSIKLKRSLNSEKADGSAMRCSSSLKRDVFNLSSSRDMCLAAKQPSFKCCSISFPSLEDAFLRDPFSRSFDSDAISSFGGGERSLATTPSSKIFDRNDALGIVGQRNGTKDELQGSYSEKLDYVRESIASIVPVAEDMVSKAIISAFSEDERDTSSIVEEADEVQFEVDALSATIHWAAETDAYDSPYSTPDGKESFLQGSVNKVVERLRRGSMLPSSANRIVHELATLLELELSAPMLPNVILLFDLDIKTSVEDLRKVLGQYGEIEAVGIAREDASFGACRFVNASAAKDAIEGGILIAGVYPTISPLSQSGRRKSSVDNSGSNFLNSSENCSWMDEIARDVMEEDHNHFERKPNSICNDKMVLISDFKSIVRRPEVLSSQKSMRTASTATMSADDYD